MQFIRYGILGGLLATGPLAHAGPDWAELPPGAGDLPPEAQPVLVSPVNSIAGELKGPTPLRGSDPPDFEDMYLIYINHPALFSARTDGVGDNFAAFNSQLWLFDTNGRGVLGNNDSSATPGQPGSLLRFPPDDGVGNMPAPGFYYLAISGFGNTPQSLGGPIFNFATPTEVSGPDGPGGSIPISSWTGLGEFGTYRISLTGVVPAPGCAAALGVVGAFGLARRRR